VAGVGYRGKILARKRAAQGVGQAHLAKALGMTGPELSRFEREVYGGLPRGLSARYIAALDALSECYPRCGCRAGSLA